MLFSLLITVATPALFLSQTLSFDALIFLLIFSNVDRDSHPTTDHLNLKRLVNTSMESIGIVFSTSLSFLIPLQSSIVLSPAGTAQCP
jgi:hypothetical protein